MITAAVGVPETQDAVSSLDTSGGSDIAVVTQFTVAPHPEQLDGGGAPSGPFEVPGSLDVRNELAALDPPSDEGESVIPPSPSALPYLTLLSLLRLLHLTPPLLPHPRSWPHSTKNSLLTAPTFLPSCPRGRLSFLCIHRQTLAHARGTFVQRTAWDRYGEDSE